MKKLPWFTLSVVSLLFGVGFLLMGMAFSEPCKILQKGSNAINPFSSYSKGISCALNLNFISGSILIALGVIFSVIGFMRTYRRKIIQ